MARLVRSGGRQVNRRAVADPAAGYYQRAMDTVLSIVVLAAVVLIGGALWLWRRGGMSKPVWLMLLLAVIMIANVLIWTLPDAGGSSPLQRVEAAGAR